jgi:chemotaxis protein MotB
MKKILFILSVLMILGGCITTQDYDARVSDISSLQQNVAALEGKVNALDQENATLKTQLKELQDEKATLAAKLKATEEARADWQKENTVLKAQIDELIKQRDAALTDKDKTVSNLKGTYDDLLKEMKKEIETGQITITQLKDKLTLSMVEKVLFDSGSAEIKKDGKKVLDRVGEILKQVTDKQINIEGHTDNVPISSKLQQRFPTNWELSTTRATTVVRYLQEKAGLDPKLMNAAGFAEYRPLEPNDTEEGRAKNRRIEIILTPLGLEKTSN